MNKQVLLCTIINRLQDDCCKGFFDKTFWLITFLFLGVEVCNIFYKCIKLWLTKQRLSIFEIFLRKKVIDEKPCFSPEKQPHLTDFGRTREHHCDVLLFCTSALAVMKSECRIVLTPRCVRVYEAYTGQDRS